MKRPGLKEFIEKITCDGSRTVDERMDDVFAVREELPAETEEERLENDVTIFTALIDMVKKENEGHAEDLSLLQLFTLLAETCVGLKRFRALGDVAYEVLEVLRDEMTPWETCRQTVPRIAEAVGRSVFRHSLYELLLRHFRTAVDGGAELMELKPQVETVLKLRLLLEPDGWMECLFTKPMQAAVARMFTSGELLRIMLHPELGHLRHDPVEYTREWERIYYDVEEELERRFDNAPRGMGFCFHFWNAKRELLSERYGIEWRSPSQMNPRVMFD